MNDNFEISALLKKKTKRVNSKTKGNVFQRKIAKTLNERFNTTDFSPTPGSGAFATTHKLPEHLQIYGDLITPRTFKYVIECKKGYNKENLGSFFNPKSELLSFVEQVKRDSTKANKEWLIIFQQDRKTCLGIVDATKPVVKHYLDTTLSSNYILMGGKYLVLPLEELLQINLAWGV
jgi:hypothetical protein